MELSVVVIISKSDSAGLKKTLRGIDDLDAEVILFNTTESALLVDTRLKCQLRIINGKWNGYDRVRYNAAKEASNDWVLMLHTGEELDTALKDSLQNVDYSDIYRAYRIRFNNYYKGKHLRHGEWGREYHIRLANKKSIKMDNEQLNETFFYKQGVLVSELKGSITHNIVNDSDELVMKYRREAYYAAAKYHLQGRRTGIIKLWLSPVAAFIKNYFFKLGILDGWYGYVFSKMQAWHHFIKHSRLRQLNRMIKTPL